MFNGTHGSDAPTLIDENELIEGLIEVQAEKYMKLLPAPQQNCELQEHEVNFLLNMRQQRSAAILAGNMSIKDIELERLEGKVAKMVTANMIEYNPNARLCYFYSDMAKETCAHALRIKLRCYREDSKLIEYEQAYKGILEAVSKEEYEKRLNEKYSAEKQDLELIKVSQQFATTTLALFNAQKMNKS